MSIRNSRVPTFEDVLKDVTRFLTELLADREIEPVPLIGPDTLLFDADGSGAATLALDSLDALDLISALEKEYGVEVPGEIVFATIRTVEDIANVVVSIVQ
jgi:acyl carrier protein